MILRSTRIKGCPCSIFFLVVATVIAVDNRRVSRVSSVIATVVATAVQTTIATADVEIIVAKAVATVWRLESAMAEKALRSRDGGNGYTLLITTKIDLFLASRGSDLKCFAPISR